MVSLGHIALMKYAWSRLAVMAYCVWHFHLQPLCLGLDACLFFLAAEMSKIIDN